ELPKASAEPLSADSKTPLVASVNRDGQYFLNESPTPDAPMSAEDLAVMVAAQLQVDPERPVMVNGDGAVSYNQIVQLMVLLKRAGVPSVGLMTDEAN